MNLFLAKWMIIFSFLVYILDSRHETARRETLDLSRVPKSRVPCQMNM